MGKDHFIRDGFRCIVNIIYEKLEASMDIIYVLTKLGLKL